MSTPSEENCFSHFIDSWDAVRDVNETKVDEPLPEWFGSPGDLEQIARSLAMRKDMTFERCEFIVWRTNPQTNPSLLFGVVRVHGSRHGHYCWETQVLFSS